MGSFYGVDGFPKREIYIEAAETAARTFERAPTSDRKGMTNASIRRLFNMLKQTEQRIQGERDGQQAFGLARTAFYEFTRQVEYQVRRQVVPDVFQEFVKAHLNLSTSSTKEFRGFVEYLTSIMARMRQK